MNQPHDEPPVSEQGNGGDIDSQAPVEDEDDDSWQEQCDFLTARIVTMMRADGPTPWQKLIAQQRRADSMKSDGD